MAAIMLSQFTAYFDDDRGERVVQCQCLIKVDIFIGEITTPHPADDGPVLTGTYHDPFSRLLTLVLLSPYSQVRRGLGLLLFL